MDKLLENHNDPDVATALHERGHRTGAGESFTATSVAWARQSAGLQTQFERLRAKGMLTTAEFKRQTGLSNWKIQDLRDRGLLRARQTRVTRGWLYEPLDRQPIEITERIRAARARHNDESGGGLRRCHRTWDASAKERGTRHLCVFVIAFFLLVPVFLTYLVRTKRLDKLCE